MPRWPEGRAAARLSLTSAAAASWPRQGRCSRAAGRKHASGRRSLQALLLALALRSWCCIAHCASACCMLRTAAHRRSSAGRTCRSAPWLLHRRLLRGLQAAAPGPGSRSRAPAWGAGGSVSLRPRMGCRGGRGVRAPAYLDTLGWRQRLRCGRRGVRHECSGACGAARSAAGPLHPATRPQAPRALLDAPPHAGRPPPEARWREPLCC